MGLPLHRPAYRRHGMLDAWVQGVEVLLGEEELDRVNGGDGDTIDDPEKLIEHLKEQKGVLLDYED